MTCSISTIFRVFDERVQLAPDVHELIVHRLRVAVGQGRAVADVEGMSEKAYALAGDATRVLSRLLSSAVLDKHRRVLSSRVQRRPQFLV